VCWTLRVLLLVLLMLGLGLGLVLLHVRICVVLDLLVCVMPPLRPTISSHTLRPAMPSRAPIPYSLVAAPVRILMTLIKMMDVVMIVVRSVWTKVATRSSHSAAHHI
jgi:hypothetical protein